MTKICSSCKTEKTLDNFSKDKNRKDGIYTQCKTCVSEYWKHYYKENHERRLTNQRKASYKWRHAHPEAKAADAKRWNEKNRKRKAHYASTRRAQKESNGIYEIRDSELKKLYASPCFYCGKYAKIDADHVIPISRGGQHSIGNLVPSCRSCNTSKNNKTIMEWRKSRQKL